MTNQFTPRVTIGVRLKIEGVLAAVYPPGMDAWGAYLARIMQLSGQAQRVAIEQTGVIGEFNDGCILFGADEPIALRIILDELRGLKILDYCVVAVGSPESGWHVVHPHGSAVDFDRYAKPPEPKKPTVRRFILGVLEAIQRACWMHALKVEQWKAQRQREQQEGNPS